MTVKLPPFVVRIFLFRDWLGRYSVVLPASVLAMVAAATHFHAERGGMPHSEKVVIDHLAEQIEPLKFANFGLVQE